MSAAGVMLAPSFSLAEFEASETATRLGIDNRVPLELLANARETCAMLQRIRDWLSAHFKRDCPLIVSSGYRCLLLNRAIGSGDTSDHLQARAADWRVLRGFGTSMEVCRLLAPRVDELRIGQLINEYPPEGWVHTSTHVPAKVINRVITITHAGTSAGVVPALA